MTKIIHLEVPEAQLIAGCCKGDRKAQYQLYVQHAPRMLAVCRRYTASLEDAEEVLSNGFVKAFQKIASYQGSGSFEGWLKRIMVNESLNFIRYKKNLFLELSETDGHEPADAQAFESETAAQLLELIDQLPLGYKTVFNLYAIEGYNHKEIAELLHITEGTSKSQLSKARAYLQHQLHTKKILKKQ
jgi:RNA polymerase sigma-70 factor (ECF subfamily)